MKNKENELILNSRFGAFLKDKLNELNVNVKELSHLTGINDNTLYKITADPNRIDSNPRGISIQEGIVVMRALNLEEDDYPDYVLKRPKTMKPIKILTHVLSDKEQRILTDFLVSADDQSKAFLFQTIKHYHTSMITPEQKANIERYKQKIPCMAVRKKIRHQKQVINMKDHQMILNAEFSNFLKRNITDMDIKISDLSKLTGISSSALYRAVMDTEDMTRANRQPRRVTYQEGIVILRAIGLHVDDFMNFVFKRPKTEKMVTVLARLLTDEELMLTVDLSLYMNDNMRHFVFRSLEQYNSLILGVKTYQ